MTDGVTGKNIAELDEQFRVMAASLVAAPEHLKTPRAADDLPDDLAPLLDDFIAKVAYFRRLTHATATGGAGCYNLVRLHSARGYHSPVTYEQEFAQASMMTT